MSFLLDTDICSAHLKQRGGLTHRFIQHMGHLHVPTVVVGELYSWVLRSRAAPRRLHDLVDLLNDLVVLDLTETIAKRFGEIRAEQLDQGRSPPEIDLFIAATALLHDLTVVTHNVADFAFIP